MPAHYIALMHNRLNELPARLEGMQQVTDLLSKLRRGGQRYVMETSLTQLIEGGVKQDRLGRRILLLSELMHSQRRFQIICFF